MRRCIEIARNGLGTTAPNPMVGCVIVHKGKIIGEGFTSPFGGSHAEVNAINSVIDKSKLEFSTLYVTLEPCSHFGKTPPCTDIIIQYRIPKIVIGTTDTNRQVNGAGISKLKALNCEVKVGVLEKECREHHKRFFTFHEKKRPFIILKWAESSDGFLSPKTKAQKAPVWLTNNYSRQLVHKWRSEEQAILVGANTVREDNPSLTVRNFVGKNPLRIVLDPNGLLDLEYKVFNGEARTLVIGHKETTDREQDSNLIRRNIDWKDKGNIALQISNLLYSLDISSVIIEGGRITLETFLKEGLWDEIRVFKSETLLNGGTEAPRVQGTLIKRQQILKDSLFVFNND